MTISSARAEKVCSQHHVPRSKCPPDAHHVRAVRFRDDTWGAAERVSGAASNAIVPATEAFLGFVRCRRCDAEVQLRPGDLTGTTLPAAYAEARKHARHPDHEPVWLGAAPAPVAADDIAVTMEHLRAQVEQVQAQAGHPAPSARPGAAKFMSPGGVPHVTPVPEVPDHSAKKGRVRT